MYIFLSGLGLLVIVGLHQLLESRKVKINTVEKNLNQHPSYNSHIMLLGVRACVRAEEASSSEGGNRNLEPQRCGPELDPPGDAQPDQYVRVAP